MTAKEVWESMLTELSKVNAPSMLLQDFNYFFNKAIRQYINKRYNIYDVNLQTTDDLRVLKSTAILPVTLSTENSPLKELADLGAGKSKLFGATYEAIMPSDYLHLLNCICIYKVNKRYKCYNAGDYVQFAAKRLTADAWSVIINDYYNRPLPLRPYYYIHLVNINEDVPTNPLTEDNPNGTDIYQEHYVGPTTVTTSYKFGTDAAYYNPADGLWYKSYDTSTKTYSDKFATQPTSDELTVIRTETPNASDHSNFPRSITLGSPSAGTTVSTVERWAGQRYGNASNVRVEVRYGHDNSVFELEKVFVDYIKTPQEIRLTQEQVNLTEDTSQIMEFPDYVCQEIINELTNLVMENTADPRLLTHPVITTSIANPAQALTPQPQATRQQRALSE